MPRRPTRTVPTVLLTSPIADRPEDWPRWLASRLTDAGREVRLCPAPDPAEPQLTDWANALAITLAGLDDDGFDVLAHSIGCLLWLHHAAELSSAPRPARVALVAPPAVSESITSGPAPATASALGSASAPASGLALATPAPNAPSAAVTTAAWASFYPVPLDIDRLRRAADGTVLVGSDNDPYCPGGVAHVYGAPLKMATTVITGAAALTAESGYGQWPAVLDWCGRDNLAFIA